MAHRVLILRTFSENTQKRIQGRGRGARPLFLAKSILFFYIVYNV